MLATFSGPRRTGRGPLQTANESRRATRCAAGVFTVRQLELEDKKRVEDAQNFASEKRKRRRKTLRKRRKGLADQAAEQEGTPYEAGAF